MLYVGKAKNLKNRLTSYRLATLPKTVKMLSQSTCVHFQVLSSEIDALIVEAELIRTHQPPYNIRLKDDKSPLYIVITKEPYPRVYIWRKNQLIKPTVPLKASFGPYASSKDVKTVLRYARRLFPYCSASNTDRKHKHACLYFHLNLCPGVCAGMTSRNLYSRNIRHLMLLLKGQKTNIIRQLTKEVEALSQKLAFEEAAMIKQLIVSLTQSTPSSTWEQTLPEVEGDTNLQALTYITRDIRPYLNLPASYRLSRIEAYDISHLQGSDPTASMVVMNDGVCVPSEYRRFKIKTISGINDQAMLLEAIKRRLTHREWHMPKLIILDGGRSQVTYVKNHLHTNIPIIGLAKNPDRLIIPDSAHNTLQVIPIDETHTHFRKLCVLRDEAHRFTKKYHTLLHIKHYT